MTQCRKGLGSLPDQFDGLEGTPCIVSIRPWHASFSAAWRSFKALACARLRLSRPFMRRLLLAKVQGLSRNRPSLQ